MQSPNSRPLAAADRQTVATRGDVVKLPDALQDRLVQLADRPYTNLPTQAFAEADNAIQLFQYYLLDTEGFEPNVLTHIFPGINDAAFIDVFTDISPLFVINNESGWYEGWTIHDVVVPDTAAPRKDGEIGKLQSIVPGSGPRGINNDPRVIGDNPNLPRDPDKFDGTVDAQREFRQRAVSRTTPIAALPRRNG